MDGEDDIKLWIETNIWLDPGELIQCLYLKLFSENAAIEIQLIQPDVKIEWPSRGRFVVDIADYVKILYNRRRKIRRIF